MVRPHTRNGFLRDGKNNIRMEASGLRMDRKTENKVVG
jgi:hypothetical protein